MTTKSGVYRWADLQEFGVTPRQADKLVAAGDLLRLRRGWYATGSADRDVVSAVKAGGVLSCVSALKWRGVWTPTTTYQWKTKKLKGGAMRWIRELRTADRVHVRGNESAHRRGNFEFCRQHGDPEAEGAAVDELPIALRHAVRCLDPEGIVVVLDSLQHHKLMTTTEITEALSAAPRRIRRLIYRCARAESGTETMVRLRLRAKGVKLEPQVTIAGVGRVDFLVGRRLVIEVDSKAHHTGEENYRRDRERDLELVRLGYIVVRLTYDQVMYGWDVVEKKILELIGRREHLKKLQPTELTAVPELDDL